MSVLIKLRWSPFAKSAIQRRLPLGGVGVPDIVKRALVTKRFSGKRHSIGGGPPLLPPVVPQPSLLMLFQPFTGNALGLDDLAGGHQPGN